MRLLKRLIRRYPEQAILLAFNTGVFAWLQATGLAISERLGLNQSMRESLVAGLPDWLVSLIGESSEQLQAFFTSSPFAWLLISLLLSLLIRWVTGLIKWVLFFIIIGIGLFFLLQNQAILSQLNII